MFIPAPLITHVVGLAYKLGAETRESLVKTK